MGQTQSKKATTEIKESHEKYFKKIEFKLILDESLSIQSFEEQIEGLSLYRQGYITPFRLEHKHELHSHDTNFNPLLCTMEIERNADSIILNFNTQDLNLQAGNYYFSIQFKDGHIINSDYFKIDKPCVFCSEEVRSKALYIDDEIMIVKDLYPSSNEAHLLAIPINHIPNVYSLTSEHIELLEKLYIEGNKQLDILKVKQRKVGFHTPPFIMINHLHLHLLATPTNSMLASVQFNAPFIFWPYHDLLDKLKKSV